MKATVEGMVVALGSQLPIWCSQKLSDVEVCIFPLADKMKPRKLLEVDTRVMCSVTA